MKHRGSFPHRVDAPDRTDELTSPELTVEDSGRLLVITLHNGQRQTNERPNGGTDGRVSSSVRLSVRSCLRWSLTLTDLPWSYIVHCIDIHITWFCTSVSQLYYRTCLITFWHYFSHIFSHCVSLSIPAVWQQCNVRMLMIDDVL